ncbi:MAG: hypothetical protein HOC20_02845, partial [Chloroflexi bacterium]|nr:hypothetical protein [Chloroflexota bacterium]
MKKSAPFYQTILPEHVQKIDQKGRQILEEIGVSITGETFLNKLEAEGAHVDFDNHRVRFGGACLDKLLSRAPSR